MGTATPAVEGGSSLRMHELRMRPEGSKEPDGTEALWVIGRVETGDFISVPAVARRAVQLLADGHTVEDVHRRLYEETGADIDVADFVTSLIELGFVQALDGVSLAEPVVPKATLPGLTARHVRWTVHPVTALVAGAVVLAGLIAVLLRPGVFPHYRDLVWNGSASAVITGNAAIAWTLILFHELAHLATARAVGVPARMSLGTRLQFLAVQTDVSGVWAQPRVIRLTVYLAGIVVNLVLAATGLLVLASDLLPDPLAKPATAAVLLSLSMVPPQFLLFMRTDIYFVLQDLTGCANLYADGSAYVRYALRRMYGRTGPDPSMYLARRERLAVRWYAAVLLLGTTSMLAFLVAWSLPATATLLAQAFDQVVSAHSAAQLLDGAAALLTIGFFQLLWARAWWRRHGGRVRRFLTRRKALDSGRHGRLHSRP